MFAVTSIVGLLINNNNNNNDKSIKSRQIKFISHN